MMPIMIIASQDIIYIKFEKTWENYILTSMPAGGRSRSRSKGRKHSKKGGAAGGVAGGAKKKRKSKKGSKKGKKKTT